MIWEGGLQIVDMKGIRMKKITKYICLFLLSFSFSIRPDNEMPVLEFEDGIAYDGGLEFLVSEASVPKIPAWQLTLQRWGTKIALYLVKMKSYISDQYIRVRKYMFCLLFSKKRQLKSSDLSIQNE